ncbi:MAG: hypothetical protein VW886_06510, partial [Candidatus Heimdallarchaeota archaeon]
MFESYSGSLDELGSKFRNIRENLKYLSFDNLDIEKLRIFGGPINYGEQKQELSDDQVEDRDYNILEKVANSIENEENRSFVDDINNLMEEEVTQYENEIQEEVTQ